MFVLKCGDDRLKDDRKRIRGFEDNKSSLINSQLCGWEMKHEDVRLKLERDFEAVGEEEKLVGNVRKL
jgi:hypothetical protein